MNENISAEYADETHSSDWFAQVVEAAYKHELVGKSVNLRGRVDVIGHLGEEAVASIVTNVHLSETVDVYAVALDRNKSRGSYYPVIYGTTRDKLIVRAGSGFVNNALELEPVNE